MDSFAVDERPREHPQDPNTTCSKEWHLSEASIALFAFGGVGFASRISSGEMAFRVVMGNHTMKLCGRWRPFWETEASTQELRARRNPHFAAERFDALYPAVAHSPEKVHRMQGCILYEDTLQEIAKQIDGAYDEDVSSGQIHESRVPQSWRSLIAI